MDEMERLAERECLARFHRTEQDRRNWWRLALRSRSMISWTTVLQTLAVLAVLAAAVYAAM